MKIATLRIIGFLFSILCLLNLFSEDTSPQKSAVSESDGFTTVLYSKSSLSFIMGDDNLRDNSQYSPKWDIGTRHEYENFANRVYGYSNTAKSATKLSLFHQENGFVENFSAKIYLSFLMYNSMNSINNRIDTSLREDRSFIEVDYCHPSTSRFKLTFYPYNADNVAIGFFRGLRWGQNRAVWPQQDSSAVPGFQVLYGYHDFSIYFGFKANAQPETDRLSSELTAMETTYGFFGGTSYSSEKTGIKAHIQGAYIDKGDNVIIPENILENPDDDKILSYGIDFFIQYSLGSQIGDPVGINTFSESCWIKPDYTSNFAFRIRSEYLFQNERLQNGDYLRVENEKTDRHITENFFAHGAVFETAFRFKGIRMIFMYSYRDLPFMVFDSPGVEPYQTISSESSQTPEHLFVISADYHFWHLWFGFSYGYKIPATYTVYDLNDTKNVTVIKERLSTDAVSTAFNRSREVLPAGRNPLDMAFIKLNLKYGFSDSVSAELEYSFTQDHNRQKMVKQDNGLFLSEFDNKEVVDIHGLFFLIEGRF